MDIARAYALLMTDDTTGAPRGAHAQGLAGAVLLTMLRDGALEVDDRRLHTRGQRPRDFALAPVWDTIDGARRPKSITSWVGNVAVRHARQLREDLLRDLVNAGHVSREERSFGRVRHPQVDGTTEEALRAELRAVLDADGRPDPELGALLALVQHTWLAKVALDDRDDRRTARRKVRHWKRNDLLPAEVALVLRAVEESVAAAAF